MTGSFHALPAAVHDAVAEQAGPLRAFTPAADGERADVCGTLDAAGGRVFIKAVRPDSNEAGSLRNEAAALPHATPWAPGLLWQVESKGWILLGLEHIDGRHADFSPRSPDVPALAGAVRDLGVRPCPDAVTRRVEELYDLPALDMCGEDVLLHADLNPANILITPDHTARIVDWAYACRGPAWIELALWAPRLLHAGWTPAAAETLMSTLPAWQAADPRQVDRVVKHWAQMWTRRAAGTTQPQWVRWYAARLRAWHQHRTQQPRRSTIGP